MSAELKEALAWAARTWEWWVEEERQHVAVLAEAARRVAEADEVWWCSEHLATQLTVDRDGVLFCWKHHTGFLAMGKPYSACVMIPGRLLLPAEEEK